MREEGNLEMKKVTNFEEFGNAEDCQICSQYVEI